MKRNGFTQFRLNAVTLAAIALAMLIDSVLGAQKTKSDYVNVPFDRYGAGAKHDLFGLTATTALNGSAPAVAGFNTKTMSSETATRKTWVTTMQKAGRAIAYIVEVRLTVAKAMAADVARRAGHVTLGFSYRSTGLAAS